MPVTRITAAELPSALRKRRESAGRRAADAKLNAALADRPGLQELVRRGLIAGRMVTQATCWELQSVLEAFRDERLRLGLSLAELAERLGTNQGNLSRFETGRQPNPSIDTLQRYALALGLVVKLSVQPSGQPPVAVPGEPKTRRRGKRRRSKSVTA